MDDMTMAWEVLSGCRGNARTDSDCEVAVIPSDYNPVLVGFPTLHTNLAPLLQEQLPMNSKLLSCGKLEIPGALTLDHEELRSELIVASEEPGRIGIAEKKVTELCLPHFAKEEENIFHAFGVLHDLAAARVRPDMAAVTSMIAQFSAQHYALRDRHQSIKAALEELLQEARKEDNEEIAQLVYTLRNHEKIEDEVMYPTVLLIDRSVRESLGT